MCAQWSVVAGAEISPWMDGWDGWDDGASNGATMQDQDFCREEGGADLCLFTMNAILHVGFYVHVDEVIPDVH